MITQRAIRPAQTDTAVTAEVCDPTSGIVRQCFELPLEPEDPRIFCFVSEATDTSRFRIGVPRCNRFGCGVGLTREWAAGAAMGEVLERYSAAIYDRQDLIYASYDELAEEATPPDSFALFSCAQYESFAEEEARGVRARAYRPFRRDTKTGWVQGFNLSTQRPTLVPGAFVYLPYQYARDEAYIVDSISSGAACAEDRDEATLRALYEVVERDAISIRWYNRQTAPRIRLDADDALARLVRERFACRGVRYVMVDATVDIRIPTFLGFLIDERGGTAVASATRLNPLDAARKTMLEAAQGRIAWKREMVLGPPEAFSPDFSDVLDFPDHSKVYMDPAMRQHIEYLWSSPEAIRLEEVEDRSTGNATSDLQTCVNLLRERGLEVIAVDVTTPDVREAGYFVIRVVVPGIQVLNARHDSPLFGGRRLREVPFYLGWTERPVIEAELNRFLHPFP